MSYRHRKLSSIRRIVVELLIKKLHLLTMKNKLQKILSKLRELQPDIIQKYHVSSIEIFGSYVRNEQKIKSDLDLLVTFSIVPSLLKYMELKNFLSDKLEVNVDLVMKNALKPGISQYILNESISI